jgi:hypothetical protein
MWSSQGTVLAAGERALAAPHRRSTTLIATSVHGTFRGYPAAVRCDRPDHHVPNSDVSVSVAIEAPTYGVIMHVRLRGGRQIHIGTPPPVPASVLAWDPAFRERFQVGGAPASLVHEWLDSGLQSALLQNQLSSVDCDGPVVRIGVPLSQAVDPQRLTVALELAFALATRLPTALAAQGLPLGPLTAHPEVVAYRRRQRRGAGRAMVFLLVVVLLIGGIIAAIVAVSSIFLPG